MADEWDEPAAQSFSNGGEESSGSAWGGGSSKSMSCYKCGEEGHMSRQCQSGGGGDRPKGCFKCGEDGHISRDCTNGGSDRPKGCFKCGEEGHMSRDCPNGGGDDKPKGCFKCGEEGHMSRECTNGGSDDRPKGCFKCKEEGHIARDCPNATEEDNLGPDGKPRPPMYVPTHIADDELFEGGVGIGINFDLYDDIKVSMSGEGHIPPRMEDFASSGLRPLLLENITKSGYQRPTPIQRHCVPTIMAGRDVMACAQTGSGKTAAFVLPILHKLLEEGVASSPNTCAEPSALIVAPTRELAVQIHNEARKFALHTVLRVCVCYGGASSRSQSTALMAGCSVLVATPGRLADFIDKNYITLANIKFVVLDEADRMLDMGFVGDIEKLMNNKSMPAERQTLMFSATFPEEIQLLAAKFMTNYVFYVVGMVGAANTDVKQEVLNVAKNEKRSTLMDKLNDIVQSSGNKALVFCETKRTADFLATYLSSQNMSSTSIHGDRFQSQREEALAQFKSGTRKVLVATAVAARGLDIKGVSHVINYDLPKEVDEYVHRIGRTGRVGNKGMAISFYEETTDGPIAKNLVKILDDAKQEVPEWLKTAAATSGHGLTYEGAGDFASSDIRGNVGGGSQAFGGPAEEEDEW